MKICTAILILLILSAGVPASSVEQSTSVNLNASEYFDFWIGEWNLEWIQPDGTKATGKNRIVKIMSDRVIQENFTVVEGNNAGYTGKSWSVYDRNSRKWKQTWVDNRGVYLDFTGIIEGEKRIFQHQGTAPGGEKIIQRMVFYNITEDSFIWNWEVSTDDGVSWKVKWKIFYSRN